MEYIDIILRKNNYSIMKVKTDTFYIIKNEHGTYGEFNDFILEVKINTETNMVLNWAINEISIDKNILNNLSKEQISLFQFCKELIEIKNHEKQWGEKEKFTSFFPFIDLEKDQDPYIKYIICFGNIKNLGLS